MYNINKKDGELIALIRNNIIFCAVEDKVVGILIGDCVYGKSQGVVGKIFNSTVYLLNGEIVGKLALSNKAGVKTIRKEQLIDAWSILSGVKEHTSKWIIEQKVWSGKGLLECLS